ncbi:MFS transporter [Tropicimonas sp.]|uniref:MFS transporter n=1 Tax=Tropicimonas sp. TaxID=2067044 RepID=UPI003A8BF3B0
MSELSDIRVSIRTPWRAVAAIFALNGVLLGTWASRIPAIMQANDIGEGTFGLLLLVMGAGALISFPFSGRLSDTLGAYRVTRAIAFAYLPALPLLALAPSTGWLAVALFLFGITHGSMDVTMNSWATEVEKGMGRSVMSSFHAMWSLGGGLGAATGAGAVALGLSVTLHFVLASLIFGTIFLWMSRIDWVSQTRAHDPGAPVFALPRGALVLLGVMALASGAGEGSVVDWSAVFLTTELHVDEASAALGFTVFSIVMVAMRMVVDRLITIFGPVTVARVSGVSAALGLTLIVSSSALGTALAGFALMGIGYAAVWPMAFTRAACDPVVPPGQAIASVATLGYGAMLIAPPVIGFIAETFSLRVAFALLAMLALLVTLLARVLKTD